MPCEAFAQATGIIAQLSAICTQKRSDIPLRRRTCRSWVFDGSFGLCLLIGVGMALEVAQSLAAIRFSRCLDSRAGDAACTKGQ